MSQESWTPIPIVVDVYIQFSQQNCQGCSCICFDRAGSVRVRIKVLRIHEYGLMSVFCCCRPVALQCIFFGMQKCKQKLLLTFCGAKVMIMMQIDEWDNRAKDPMLSLANSFFPTNLIDQEAAKIYTARVSCCFHIYRSQAVVGLYLTHHFLPTSLMATWCNFRHRFLQPKSCLQRSTFMSRKTPYSRSEAVVRLFEKRTCLL